MQMRKLRTAGYRQRLLSYVTANFVVQFWRSNPCWRLSAAKRWRTPPAVWFQSHGDMMHDYKDVESDFAGNAPLRFVAAYRKAVGEIALAILRG
jgi:hypothetical protein